MNQERFTVEYHGKFSTGWTCQGPVGAFHRVTGEKPTQWVYVSDKITIVNGWTVTNIT